MRVSGLSGVTCPVCSARRFRAAVVGGSRTAEELGRMMPGVRIVQSAGDRVVADLPAEMERLQRTCALATEAVTRRYFAGAEATEWHGVRA